VLVVDLVPPTVGGDVDVWGDELNALLTTLESRTSWWVEADTTGVTSSLAALQAFLDVAGSTGGGTVYVPPGTYKIDGLLRIYRNTRLILDQGATLVHAYGGTMLLNGDAGQSFGGYTGHGGIIVEGGTWDMRGADTPTDPATCMSFGHAEGITIRNVTVKDVPGYHAIEINACKTVRIVDCRLVGYVDTGGRDFSEAIQLDLAKGSAYFGGFGPYDHTPCFDVAVRGCHFGSSGTAGTTAWPRGIGSHAATIGKWHSRIRVSDCSFDGVLQRAIVGYNWTWSSATGNVITNCGSGIRVRSIDTADTADTVDTSGVQTSASQDLSDWVITGNIIRSCTGYDQGLDLFGETTGKLTRLTVVGNTVDDIPDTDGIRGTFLSTSTIEANTVSLTGTHGIACSSCLDMLVKGNHVLGASRAATNTSSGIFFGSTCVGFAVIGNRVRPWSSGNAPKYGLEITGTNSGGRRHGNDLGASGYGTANLVDAAACSTSTADG
jgi:hypothetical protein